MRPPTFLIIGAKRSGTTSLARYLGAHPEVFIAEDKELHFFDRHLDRGVEWYRSQFDGAGAASHTGEATQTYLFDPRIPPLIASVVPEAKLIAILRNPIDRAHSDYWWRRARGLEDLSFEDALEAEPERAASGDEGYWHSSYLGRGRYAEQLEVVFEHFQRERVHVLLTEDLESEPIEAYRRVCDFLDVRNDFVPDMLGRRTNAYVSYRFPGAREATASLPRPVGKLVARLNQRRGDRYEPMSDATRARLVEVFREPNRQLGAMLDRNLDHWNA